MKKTISKYKLFYIFVFIAVWSALQSTVVNNVLHFPLPLSRVFTLLSYLPFIVAIVWKIISDLKERKFRLPDILYYLFALYYAAISAYRFLNHMEVQENLYYAIMLFGSLAMCMQITAGRFSFSNQDLVDNVVAIGIFMALFRLTDRLVFQHFLAKPPININLTTGVSALIIPVLFDACCEKKISIPRLIVHSLTLLASLVIILTTGSRAIFLLSLVILVAMMVFKIKTGMVFKRILPIVLCAVVIVGAMAAMDVGDVRYSLYRETSISLFSDTGSKPADDADTTEPPTEETTQEGTTTEPSTEETTQEGATTEPSTEETTQESTTEPVVTDPPKDNSENNTAQDSAVQQISHSDKMRSDLVKMGIKQVKQNVLFGTGDVVYPYHITEIYAPMQSAHNFIIESLICFGAVGTVMLLLLFLALVFETKFYRRKGTFRAMFSLVMTMVFFFGFGMVQPTVYSQLMTPLFAWIWAYYKQKITDLEMK